MADTTASSGPTWEETVNRIVLPGNPAALRQSSDAWQRAMAETNQLQLYVKQVHAKSQSWTGQGANAFRAYCDKVSSALDQNYQHHQKIWNALRSCADALQVAITSIPLPGGLESQVDEVRTRYQQSGPVDGYGPGAFLEAIRNYTLAQNQGMIQMHPELGAQVDGMARLAYDKGTPIAQAAYAKLQEAYKTALSMLPQTSSTTATTKKGPGAAKTTAPTNKAPTNTTPNLPTRPNTTTPLTASAATPSMPAVDTSVPSIPTDAPLDPSQFASASPSALTTAGGGLDSKLAKLAGLAGVGGFGGGGAGLGGAKLPELGPTLSADAMNGSPMGGAAGSTLAMAGAAEQGATNTSTNGMMGGMGPGGAGPKDQGKHDVKLWSDDDVFSAGRDTAPSVIT
jgi:uncharacterized protein YukE